MAPNLSRGRDAQQFDGEQQCRAAGDRAFAVGAIGQLVRDREFDLVADAHQRDAFLPPLDDAVERKAGRFAAFDRAVEFLAIGEGADIMDGDAIGWAGLGAAAIAGDPAPTQPAGRHAPAIGTLSFGERRHLAVEPCGALGWRRFVRTRLPGAGGRGEAKGEGGRSKKYGMS